MLEVGLLTLLLLFLLLFLFCLLHVTYNMQLVLQIGNFLNVGGCQGPAAAQGFRIRFLTQVFKSIKTCCVIQTPLYTSLINHSLLLF